MQCTTLTPLPPRWCRRTEVDARPDPIDRSIHHDLLAVVPIYKKLPPNGRKVRWPASILTSTEKRTRITRAAAAAAVATEGRVHGHVHRGVALDPRHVVVAPPLMPAALVHRIQTTVPKVLEVHAVDVPKWINPPHAVVNAANAAHALEAAAVLKIYGILLSTTTCLRKQQETWNLTICRPDNPSLHKMKTMLRVDGH